MYKIDKTEALEKKLEQYPSVYVEAAAASGKTTAVAMLLHKHPEIIAHSYDMAESQVQETIGASLEELYTSMKNKNSGQKEAAHWIVLDNLPGQLTTDIENALITLVCNLWENWKVVFVSREQPSVRLLELYWKGQMDILPQKELAFTLQDVQKLVSHRGSALSAKDLYQVTGGWAGCVNTMLRMGQSLKRGKNHEYLKHAAEILRDKYEIDSYVRREIIDTLSEQEQTIVNRSMFCPWFDITMCRDIWKLEDVKQAVEGLERKGILTELSQRGRWSLAPLFSEHHQAAFPWKLKNRTDMQIPSEICGEELAWWYERRGHIREALWCIKCFGTEEQYFNMLLKHYDKVPFIDISYEEVLEHSENIPELCYLRGMYYLSQGDFAQVSTETRAIEKSNHQLYLNLSFVNPEVSLEDWLTDLNKLVQKREKGGISEKMRLFDPLGSSHTYLCGMRDLTGLFACSKKEENKWAGLWKRAFDEETNQAYCLARLDYFIETDREKALCTEDSALLSRITEVSYLEKESDRRGKTAMAGLYLLCRLQTITPEEDRKEQILQLKEALAETGNAYCINNAEAIVGLYAQMLGNPEQIGRWLLSVENRAESELTHIEKLCQIKGYMFLQQYEKAEKPLERMLGTLSKYRMHYQYAEALFAQAILNWHKDFHGQALKNAIESFLIAGTGRYVGLYTNYGKSGLEVIKSYVEWMQSNALGGWNTKKKYNYGHVLRMPMEDYLEYVQRRAKRNIPKEKVQKEPIVEERLTMMETVVLQDISRGLTNADICAEQNLKLSTVKTHIYSIYKKLGVNTRVQATIKGREIGLIK